MGTTLQSLLDEHDAALIGRDAERAALMGLLGGDRPLFAAVHGIAGVGKSTLLRAFAADAQARGARVVRLDCAAVEPTERGFLAALGTQLDAPGGRILLLLDTYERFRLLDAWLRQDLVPVLPSQARVVLAGRDPPVAWRRSFGDLLLEIRLGRLDPASSRAVLMRAGVRPADADRVDRLAQGHPLALQLAAAALASQPRLAVEEAALGPLVEELAAAYPRRLDALTRRALDAASIVRRPTVPLLDAMLPEDGGVEAFERLRALPFVELGREGLVIHDTLREVTAQRLRAVDPPTYRAYRIAAWSQLRRELREASRRDLWRYTADMLYLVEHPVVREAFFPSGSEDFAMEAATETDETAITEITLAHATPEMLAVVLAWWDLVPDAFRVARDASGMVQAFTCLSEAQDVPARILARDPLAAAWREHLRRDPVPRGQRVLFGRFTLARESGERSSPASAATALDIKRRYLELRPELRRVYLPAQDLDACLPPIEPLGFVHLPLPVAIGGQTFQTLMNDFGPASIDGWLSDVVGRELAATRDGGVLDAHARQLVVDGNAVELTRLEWNVLRYLREREGNAVPRDELLRDVWGYEWSGGSNVLEVVVSALRKKLGAQAVALETVRGVGYRLGPTA